MVHRVMKVANIAESVNIFFLQCQPPVYSNKQPKRYFIV